MEFIKAAEDFARDRMRNFDPGHDWWHILRVRKLAAYINSAEKSADPFILEISAILHDVADSKFLKSSYSDIEEFLKSSGMGSIEKPVLNAIRNISFSNKSPDGDLKDPVFMILQDADRLDAIGAIGIARAFSYGSLKGNKMYQPSSETGGEMYQPSSETGGDKPTTIHHFYDKLLKLKDLMNTGTARNLAVERHKFLEIFLDQFYREWNLI